MSKLKDVAKSEGGGSRERCITWSNETTKYMLEWYIDVRKDKHVSSWKQQHHFQCAEALNAKFGVQATAAQVDRHFRLCKERWKWIKQATGKSGYGFDAASTKFKIDKIEKSPSKLGKTKYNYLTKTIKFFHLLEELFGQSEHTDGSLAVDQCTANDESGSDGCEDVKELEMYASTTEYAENDSDIIGHSSPIEGNSSSVKRKPLKSPSKKPQKGKGSRARVSEDDLASCIVRLADKIAVAAPNEQPASTDPYAPLWRRIESLPITSRDKLELATYLGKAEQETFCSYLNCASDSTFQIWVMDYFAKKDAVGAGPSST